MTFRIVVDTREKEEYSFPCPVIHRKLEAGDYSVQGYEDRVAIERKSLADFAHTVIHDFDRFVVGLNSDASVRLLKGPTRPIVPVEERREMLLALKSVDQVIVFDEESPLRLIAAMRPEVLIKGPDYAGRECCGATLVESYGGRVVIPDWPVRQSSTLIVERILAQGAVR